MGVHVKPISFEVTLVPNYLLHLLASARVCFDSVYADKYESTIKAPDIEFLRKNRQLLSWGSGEGGELSELAVKMPITFGLQSEEELIEYFDLLIGGLVTKSVDLFFSRYASQIAHLEHTWFPVGPEAVLNLVPLAETLENYRQVVKRNFGLYEESVWPHECSQMREVAGELDDYFDGQDIIGRWEELTGKTLAAERYTIILSSAIEGGPNANSVGYAKNIFCSRKSLDWTKDFISHEVGIHLLMSEFRRRAESENYDWMRLFAANECLVQFLNGMVLERSNLAYDLKQFGSADLLPKYAKVYQAGDKFKYADVIRRVLGGKGN